MPSSISMISTTANRQALQMTGSYDWVNERMLVLTSVWVENVLRMEERGATYINKGVYSVKKIYQQPQSFSTIKSQSCQNDSRGEWPDSFLTEYTNK